MQAVYSSRMPFIDALKAICCLLIVTHHLAIYGPMSDIAYPLIPAVLDWLREYGLDRCTNIFCHRRFSCCFKTCATGFANSHITNPADSATLSEIDYAVSGCFNFSNWLCRIGQNLDEP